MKKIFITALAVLALAIGGSAGYAQSNPESKLGWKLGAQSYTFNHFTFFEAIDKIKGSGLNYVEAFPGQKLGGGMEGEMDFHMPAAKRAQILAKLKEKGVKMVSFGVVVPKDHDDWKQLFEFAKGMGLLNITSEPEEKDLTFLSGLCDQYKINIAIHNHPQPSHYWNPDRFLAAIKGQSKRIGACADIGHWVRSGLDPLACLKKIEGHVIELHFKDLNEKSPEAHDVHWGTGVCDVAGVLKELKRQGFKGVFSAEYEYNWDDNAEDVAASAKYFRQVAARL